MDKLICSCGAKLPPEYKSMGAFTFHECEDCGETEVIMWTYKQDYQTPEQKQFWEDWTESLSLYREQFKSTNNTPEFKTWHQERLRKKKTQN